MEARLYIDYLSLIDMHDLGIQERQRDRCQVSK